MARMDQEIIDRANELREDGFFIWQRYGIATNEVEASKDSVYLGDVDLHVEIHCPCCGKAVTVELSGGQVIATSK